MDCLNTLERNLITNSAVYYISKGETYFELPLNPKKINPPSVELALHLSGIEASAKANGKSILVTIEDFDPVKMEKGLL